MNSGGSTSLVPLEIARTLVMRAPRNEGAQVAFHYARNDPDATAADLNGTLGSLIRTLPSPAGRLRPLLKGNLAAERRPAEIAGESSPEAWYDFIYNNFRVLPREEFLEHANALLADGSISGVQLSQLCVQVIWSCHELEKPNEAKPWAEPGMSTYSHLGL